MGSIIAKLLHWGTLGLLVLTSVLTGCEGGGSGDPFVVAFQVAGSASVNESGNHPVLILLVSGPAATLDGPVTVDVNSTGGSATSGLDYTGLSTTVTLPAGTALNGTVPVNLALLTDVLIEGNETVELSLSNPTGGAELQGQLTHDVTITDDEAQPSIAFALPTSATADETMADHLISVQITTGAGATLAVPLNVDAASVAGGTATSNVDYTAVAATLTFPVGAGNLAIQTVALPVLQDALVEGNETVNLTLSNPTPLGVLGAQVSHIATITDDVGGVLAAPAPRSIELRPRPADASGDAGSIAVVGGPGSTSAASKSQGARENRSADTPASAGDAQAASPAEASLVLTGLAHDPELDFLYGATADGVVAIDPETGGAQSVAPAALLVALTFDGDSGLLYGVEVDPNGARLLSIDTADGEVSVTADLADLGELSALAFRSDERKLYAALASEGALLRVDVTTGVSSRVGAFGIAEEGFIEGLAFDPTTQTLFGVWDAEGAGDSLVVIDLETGAAKTVGAGLGFSDAAPRGLGYDSVEDALFLSDDSGRLYGVDKETGVAALADSASQQRVALP